VRREEGDGCDAGIQRLEAPGGVVDGSGLASAPVPPARAGGGGRRRPVVRREEEYGRAAAAFKADDDEDETGATSPVRYFFLENGGTMPRGREAGPTRRVKTTGRRPTAAGRREGRTEAARRAFPAVAPMWSPDGSIRTRRPASAAMAGGGESEVGRKRGRAVPGGAPPFGDFALVAPLAGGNGGGGGERGRRSWSSGFERIDAGDRSMLEVSEMDHRGYREGG
jgi:hypothetical protein